MSDRVTVSLALEPGAVEPSYATDGAAGLDLHANHPVCLAPMERASIGTGVRVAIPKGYEGQVRPRSGMAIRHGFALVNSPGTIDSDYRGEIKVIAINLGSEPIQITKGDRVAQLVVCPVPQVVWTRSDDLDKTLRGEDGFGSTGK